jgi:hypothetical protein
MENRVEAKWAFLALAIMVYGPLVIFLVVAWLGG